MALYANINRSISMPSLKALAHKVILNSKLNFSKYPSLNQEKVEVLDDFTSRLMQRKSFKWEYQKLVAQRKVKDNRLVYKAVTPTIQMGQENDISLLDIEEINLLFQRAIDFGDRLTITKLIKQCIKCHKVPSLIILLHVLSVCSQNGERDTIVEVADLCEKLRPEILQENSYFEHYLAEAIWIKGNITKSLQIFEKVYRENIYLRSRIRCTLNYLILDIMTNHSEAILLNIVRLSEMLLNEYNDPFPLACIWQSCFLSEWFTDQQLALELLERNKGLHNAINNRIPYVVRVSLKFHRTEVVYRLTEVLLRFDLESELTRVLLALVDYWIKKGDLRRFNEVIKWSIKNDIALPTITQNKKLLNLLEDDDEIKLKSERSAKRSQAEYKF